MNEELQKLLLEEEFENFSRAVARAQSLEVANATARARSGRRPNCVRKLHDVSIHTSESIRDDGEMGASRSAGAELEIKKTNTYHKLDELVSQIEAQNLRYCEIAAQLQLLNSRPSNKMQSMTDMMPSFAKSTHRKSTPTLKAMQAAIRPQSGSK